MDKDKLREALAYDAKCYDHAKAAKILVEAAQAYLAILDGDKVAVPRVATADMHKAGSVMLAKLDKMKPSFGVQAHMVFDAMIDAAERGE